MWAYTWSYLMEQTTPIGVSLLDMLSDAGNISFDVRGLDAGDRGGEIG